MRVIGHALRASAVIALGLTPALVQAQTGRQNLSVSIVAASDYRHYGLSQTDSNAALRVSVDYEHDSGLFAGGFVTNVEYAYEASRQRPREIQADVYGGYLWHTGEWTSSVTVSRYLYPDIDRNYDYTQVIVGTDFRERVFLTLSYSDDYLALGRSALDYEAGVAWPLAWNLELGANLGRFRAPDLYAGEYTHWDVGLSRVFGRFGLDLRYHDSTQEYAGPLGSPPDRHLMLSVSYAIAPRGR